MNIQKSIAYFKSTFKSDSQPDIIVDGKDAPLCIDYSADFSVFFLCDCDDHYEIVQVKHLDESGLTEDELFRIGKENLRELADSIKITQHEGLLYFSGNGDFEASLLLVADIWNDWLQEYCPNGFVVAIPARDTLVVSDAFNTQGVDKLISIVERVWPDGDHLLTKSLYCYKNDKWVPYTIV